MDAVGLVEPVEDVADVVLADTLARVGDLEGQLPGIAAAADGDGAVAGRIFQRVGEQIEEYALDFLHVDGQREGLPGRGGLQLQFDAPLAGNRMERLHPFADALVEVHLRAMDLQLAVFVFAEVEYLVNQAAEYPHVLLRNLHEGVLLRGEVVGRGELRNGLRDERPRRAQVVRHVGEEHQFGLGGVLELFVEPLLLVALLLQKAVLLHELLLVAAVLPPGSQQEESDAAEQQDDGDAGV